MKNKGLIIGFAIVLFLASLFYLSFTWKTRQVEKWAASEAVELAGNDSLAVDSIRINLLDSMGPEDIYSLGVVKYTYEDCKERELNLGLDLQGGMNVTLAVDVPEIIKALSDESDDETFQEAFNAANERDRGEADFITLFKEEFEKRQPNTGLAAIFYTKELKEELPNKYKSTNQEVYDWLRKESQEQVAQAYEIIKARIDKFGVAQPNVQEVGNGRIMVELPGVKDPKRIRRLLQQEAELEFWNVYPNYEGYQFLEQAEKVIINKMKLAEGQDTTEEEESTLEDALGGLDDSGLTPLEEETDELAESSSIDTGATEDDLFAESTDSAASDSVDNLNQTPEQFAKDHPLLAKIQPNAGENQWNQSAFIGYVESRDRAQFDQWLQDPDVQSLLPSNLHFRWSFKPVVSEANGRKFYMLYALKSNRDGDPALEGNVVTDARKMISPGGEVSVSMSMNAEGAREWEAITEKASKKAPKEQIAIVLDDFVYSAPTVQNKISGGVSDISGGFTQKEADDLENILKAGKLPAPTRIVEESVVGPSLGEAAISSGITALVVGFMLVIIFMVLYYNKAGIYADIALIANLVFVIGVLASFGAALTLPGMAGLVLTVGMAVDANVLIYERIKEELSLGKQLKAAVSNGYKAALTSILDANITTLIAGAILAAFGKGPVKGFAIILVIGICCSFFTAVFLTRLFFDADIKKGRDTKFTTGLSKNVFKSVNWNFIGNRRKFYIVSAIIILAGIGSLLTKGLSTGVDFKGGWSYVIKAENTSSDDVKTLLGNSIEANTEVKTYGSNDQYRITTSYMIDDKSQDASEKVESKVIESLSDLGVTESDILSSSKVGPTIASDIRTASTWAIILSLIGMFGYIVLRFRKVGYGLGATTALFHDVMVVFSIYSIFYGIFPFALDIDQAFIAAILTVVGYSINDTVVVFDRVREFLGLHKYEKDTGAVINNAVNQTLSRTVVTSLTTLLVILVLFIAGGEGLKGFTFALLVGVAVGTYSSVCIATPVVVDIEEKRGKK